jgi:hypothetical protein
MDFLQANLIPILVVAAIAIFIIARFKSKKDKETRTKVHQEVEASALSKGIQVTGQAQGSVMGSEVMGDTDYKGTTGGINWTLKSSILRGRNTRGGNILRKSMWRTNAVNLPQGKFIMFVSTPGEMKAGPIQRGGFMNTLINKAADAMLDFYVGAYFGNENKALVNIGEDGVKLEREALKDFLILTNHETLANRFLDESTSGTIAGWKKSSQGFSRESLVDNFGLLFGPDGVILTCMANMTNAEEVKLFSDFGAVLVAKMKAVLG